MDNIAGQNVGKEVMSCSLPAYLQERDGSDPAVVKAKIDRLRFDWGDLCPVIVPNRN
jgi:hypothetical protein